MSAEASTESILRTVEKDGVTITVDAGTAAHIYARHISPDAPPGSRFEKITSLEGLMDTIKEKFDFTEIQDSIVRGRGPLEEKKFVGTADIGESMKTGVVTVEEAAQKLGIPQQDVESYSAQIDQIIALNRDGDEGRKRAFIEAYNTAHPQSKIYLSQRFPEAPITAFFDGEPLDTTELSIVVADGRLVTTMPGQFRENLPFSPCGVWAHATQEERKKLIEQFGSEEEVRRRIEADFNINARDWAAAGFIKKRT